MSDPADQELTRGVQQKQVDIVYQTRFTFQALFVRGLLEPMSGVEPLTY